MNAAERRAARWYRLRGWRILGANVWAGRNEIDLVARRGRSLRFVEVKEKRGVRFGDPAEMVTAEKQARFKREYDLFHLKWSAVLKAGDPYFSPHFRLDRPDFALKAA